MSTLPASNIFPYHFFKTKHISPESYYYLKLISNIFQGSMLVVFFILLVKTNLNNSIIELVYSVSSHFYISLLLYLFVVIFSIHIILTPLKFLNEFLLEKISHLSNQSVRNWVLDVIKKNIIGIFLLFPILLVFAFLIKSSDLWWLYFSFFLFFYSTLLGTVFPDMILPFFYKLKPIEGNELKERLLKVAEKLNLRIDGVYQIDFSKDSKKANAALVGMGKSKKIILTDTLLNNFDDKEITAVFAHECGHINYHHVQKNLIISLLTFLFQFKVGEVVYRSVLDGATNYNPQILKGIPYLLLTVTLLNFILTPFLNGISRYFEYQADHFAWNITGKTDWLAKSLIKLASINKIYKDPPVILEWFFLSHPSVVNRIKKITS